MKSYFVEREQEVIAAIDQVLEHVPAERVVITPDCGFNHSHCIWPGRSFG